MEKAIPLDKFIEHSLYDKKKGYYINKNPIGENGDFITSPQISVHFSALSSSNKAVIFTFWKLAQN